MFGWHFGITRKTLCLILSHSVFDKQKWQNSEFCSYSGVENNVIKHLLGNQFQGQPVCFYLWRSNRWKTIYPKAPNKQNSVGNKFDRKLAVTVADKFINEIVVKL